MTGRRVYIPQDFIDTLREHVAGFADESERHQWGLALMAWQGSQKRRRHRTVEGAMSFSAQELEDLFGRSKVDPLLRRVEFFVRSPGWSKKDAATRAFWFSAGVRAALAAYWENSASKPVALLSFGGGSMKVAKTLASAISSTDTNGKPIRTGLWECAKGMTTVPVNMEMVQALQAWLKAQLDDPGRVSGSLRDFIERLLDLTTKILRMSNTTLAGPGQLPQVYAVAPTGRLYARGLNLQNAPGLIKEAALHGLWEYDLSNCHFAIVGQMAQRFGASSAAIDHYIANKASVREEVADAAMISVEQAKRCMLALLYGARPSGRGRDAIPSMIGVDAARRLYAVPAFKTISREIDSARRAILAGWSCRTANGSLKNACGRAIRPSARAAEKLAHLVQGVEAKALMTVVSMHADHVVLLQHDGFTSVRQLDSRALEVAIRDAVGYHLRVEERQLDLHVDARDMIRRTKIEMDREAAPELNFESVTAD